jgi:hypothetical protein
MKDKDFSENEMLHKLEYKRSYPRVVLDSPVSLKLSRFSRAVEATAHDISFEGLRIHCDRKTAERIKDGGENARIEVTFKLPFEDKKEAIKARCAIMYMLQLIDDTHAMGMKITDIDIKKQMDLNKFIETSMEPQ